MYSVKIGGLAAYQIGFFSSEDDQLCMAVSRQIYDDLKQEADLFYFSSVFSDLMIFTGVLSSFGPSSEDKNIMYLIFHN